MKNFIAELVAVYVQAESLSEQDKDIKERAKAVAAVARAVVKDKIDDLIEKSWLTTQLCQVSRA
jgi:hypothetical protein